MQATRSFRPDRANALSPLFLSFSVLFHFLRNTLSSNSLLLPIKILIKKDSYSYKLIFIKHKKAAYNLGGFFEDLQASVSLFPLLEDPNSSQIKFIPNKGLNNFDR